MTKHNRATLVRYADRLGYELSDANSRTKMEAAFRKEPIPRYQLNPHGNQWASRVRGYVSLVGVSQALDEIAITEDKQFLGPRKRVVDLQKLAAAWNSTQPTKENLVAAQATQAPALTTGHADLDTALPSGGSPERSLTEPTRNRQARAPA